MIQDPNIHYLDNAATTMVAPEVADVIDKAMREHWANPSSLYAPGARSEEALNAARAAVAISSRRISGLTPGEGDSSMSFWFFRWMEHSRSPRQTALPPSSASSCTSICLTGERYFSMYTPPSPKAFFASSDAVKNAFSNSSGPFTSRIPYPPPPARALIKTGYPILFASLAA